MHLAVANWYACIQQLQIEVCMHLAIGLNYNKFARAQVMALCLGPNLHPLQHDSSLFFCHQR